jgi:hypothetical protein
MLARFQVAIELIQGLMSHCLLQMRKFPSDIMGDGRGDNMRALPIKMVRVKVRYYYFSLTSTTTGPKIAEPEFLVSRLTVVDIRKLVCIYHKKADIPRAVIMEEIDITAE